jgi:hypothetical protein
VCLFIVHGSRWTTFATVVGFYWLVFVWSIAFNCLVFSRVSRSRKLVYTRGLCLQPGSKIYVVCGPGWMVLVVVYGHTCLVYCRMHAPTL